MIIYGHGEDCLTFAFLSSVAPRFLSALGISEQPERLLYRYSLGRKHGFGEFDAILITASHAILIESKWACQRFNKPIILAEPQILRHQITQWIHKQWNGTHGDYSTFYHANREHFQLAFIDSSKSLPHPDSILAREIEFLFSHTLGRELINALLVFTPFETPTLSFSAEIGEESFAVVNAKYLGDHCDVAFDFATISFPSIVRIS